MQREFLSKVAGSGPALDIQHSPVRVYLAHAGQPGQAGSDHPAEKQPKSLLKTQENRKANLLPEIGNFREQGELSKSLPANVEGKRQSVSSFSLRAAFDCLPPSTLNVLTSCSPLARSR